MGDAYWRLAAAERGGIPPAGGLDPGREFPGYLPRESSQIVGREFPGYMPRENSQPSGHDIPGYLSRENVQLDERIAALRARDSAQIEERLAALRARENAQFVERIAALRARDSLGPLPESLRDGVSPYHAGGLAASEIGGLGGGSALAFGGVPAGAGSGRMTTPTMEDPVFKGQRQGGLGMDPALAGKTASIDLYNARSDPSLRLLDGVRPDASSRLPDSLRVDPSSRLPDSLRPDAASRLPDSLRPDAASRLPDSLRPDAASRMPDSLRPDASSRLPDSLRPDASTNTLFVEGLPTDCSRREVSHIFRPFIGFKQLRVIHKEPRRAGGEPYVLCFVEFADAKCAATALEALQGYKFDNDHEFNALKLQFAHFPGTRPPMAPVQS